MCQLIHVANILYFFSYAVRSIFWLRLLTVVAASLLIPYFYFQAEPLVEAICWNLLFITLNLFQMAWLVWERRPIRLTADQERLYELVFHSLSPREMLKLLHLAHWKDARPGTVLIEQDTEIDELLLLYEGAVEISNDGMRLADVGEGEFLGEMSFLTRGKTSADAIASTNIRYLSWPREELSAYLGDNPEMQTAMYSLIGINLVEKLADMKIAHS